MSMLPGCINCIDHRGGAQAGKWVVCLTLLDCVSLRLDNDLSD